MSLVRVGSLYLLLLIIQFNGAFRFANYIQDHMVLQRAPQRAVIWGFSDPGKLITLRMNDKTYTTMSRLESANKLGESIWSVSLDPVSDEGPHTIHVSRSSSNGIEETISLNDVLFGDVWICSGEANMQMTVSQIFNATEEIQNAGNYPKIRVFSAALRSSTTPVEELIDIELNWSVASPQSINGSDWEYMSAVCWLYGRMIHEALGGRPIGLIATSWGSTKIELWMPPKALQNCGITTSENMAIQPSNELSATATIDNSNLYNAMIYPFTRMVIYGAIWYQGEANTNFNTDKYSCSFSQMIQSWRQIWNERANNNTDIQFPFGFVQLSTYTNDTTMVGSFPVIRWHQTFDVGYVPNDVVPKVFMAVTIDLRDDPNGIHPRFKNDVGYRLSRSGLAIAYGQQVEFQGPIIENVIHSIDSNTVNVTYTAVSSIELRTRNGFDICCQEGKCSEETAWVATTIAGHGNLTITVIVPDSCVGKQLYGLRYLWRETPCPFQYAAIYSGKDSNLPSPSYLKLF